MNENMNGQVNGNQGNSQIPQPVQTPLGQQVQQPVINQPMMQQQAPQVQVPPVQPVSAKPTINVNDVKSKISNMDKNKTMKIAGMVCGALLIIAVFVPFMKIELFGYSSKTSIWDAKSGYDMFKYLLLLLSLIPIGTYFIGKGKNLSLLTAGVSLGFMVLIKDSMGDSGVSMSIGFWLMLLATLGLIVLNVMENIKEYKSIFMKNVSTAPATSGMVAQTFVAATPVAPVSPIVQNVPVCNNCGQPKKNPNDQFCQSCGQRY